MFTITHLIFAVSVGFALGFPIAFAMLGGLLPDIDIMWAEDTVLHRNFFHTPFAGIIITAALYAFLRIFKIKKLSEQASTNAFAFFIGWLSHVFIDTLTTYGIMWFYPISNAYYTFNVAPSMDFATNMAIIIISIAIAVVGSNERIRKILGKLCGFSDTDARIRPSKK